MRENSLKIVIISIFLILYLIFLYSIYAIPKDIAYETSFLVPIGIIILIISVATITFLGVIRTYKPKGRSISSIGRGVQVINRKTLSNSQLTTKQKAQQKPPILKSIQDSPKKTISTEKDIELYEIFKNETGKNAIWHGKITKGYLSWKEKRDKIEISVSQHQISNDIDLQRQFEEETGKNAIWRGTITKGYLIWKKKYEKNKKKSN